MKRIKGAVSGPILPESMFDSVVARFMVRQAPNRVVRGKLTILSVSKDGAQ